MFDKTTWHKQISGQSERFKEWLARRVRRDAPYLAYGGALAATLWPAIEAAAQTGQFYPVIGTLYNVASGVGAGLVANQLEQWKGQADRLTLDDVAGWIAAEAPANAELRQALDDIAAQLEALPALASGLTNADRTWFETALRQEMAALGSLPRFEATLSGMGAIAQGAGAKSAAATAPYATAVNEVGGNLTIINNPPLPSDPTPANLRQSYLTYVYRSCRSMSLLGIDPKAASDESATWLNLGAVYTALLTLSPEEHSLLTRGDLRDERRQSALARLNREPYLVLLGDPGSGKTTFVSFVAMCLAGAGLAEAEYTLDALTAPLPQNDGSDRDERQPWDHGTLLPIKGIFSKIRGKLNGSLVLQTSSPTGY